MGGFTYIWKYFLDCARLSESRITQITRNKKGWHWFDAVLDCPSGMCAGVCAIRDSTLRTVSLPIDPIHQYHQKMLQ